jgi:hypothetical protein
MNKIDNDIDLNFVENKDIQLELQSFIYEDYKKLLPFLHSDIRKYFSDLNLDFTNEEINSICGIDNIYDSNYEKIKVYSDFNFSDASDVVIYIIVSQLNNFIKCSVNKKIKIDENFNNVELYDINEKNIRCKYVCNFILLLLNEISEDKFIFNNVDAINNINNELTHQIIEYKTKAYLKEGDYIEYLMQQAFGKKLIDANDLKEEIELEQQDYDNDLKFSEQMEYVTLKAKKDYINKKGKEPTLDELETYKSNYMANMYNELENDDLINNLETTSKGKDVLDQGSGYGEYSEFDYETGDGFDYADQMIDDI